MIPDALWYPSRVPYPSEASAEDVNAFIDSRSLEYPSKLEEEFAARAVQLGVDSGMVLDVGTRVGLIALKILWKNENLVSLGLDASGPLIERARETATAWELGDRAVFQVGDPRHMRFKAAYFDLVVSDFSLHRFDDAAAVLAEVGRVLKPKGALLIRDYLRPSRFRMIGSIHRQTALHTEAMRPQVENALQAAYTRAELDQLIQSSGLTGLLVDDSNRDFFTIERRGETDPSSWVTVRDQYR